LAPEILKYVAIALQACSMARKYAHARYHIGVVC
jgi:hypothetical protein